MSRVAELGAHVGESARTAERIALVGGGRMTETIRPPKPREKAPLFTKPKGDSKAVPGAFTEFAGSKLWCCEVCHEPLGTEAFTQRFTPDDPHYSSKLRHARCDREAKERNESP